MKVEAAAPRERLTLEVRLWPRPELTHGFSTWLSPADSTRLWNSRPQFPRCSLCEARQRPAGAAPWFSADLAKSGATHHRTEPSRSPPGGRFELGQILQSVVVALFKRHEVLQVFITDLRAERESDVAKAIAFAAVVIDIPERLMTVEGDPGAGS